MKKVTLFRGDGIGPEICESVKAVFDALKVDVEFEEFNVGENEYLRHGALIPQEAFDSIERNKVIL
ncbi:MAG: isocitrate/isopropylmalate family dehydrogenase, partial [Traorella sp.]